MATRYWIGDAQKVPQVDTLTPGSLSIGETLTVTINGKTSTHTITSTTMATEVDAFVATLAAITTIEEFDEITWAANSDSSAITATGPSDGAPITITTSASGGGVTFSKSTTTSPSGPHHFDEADNWSGGAVPVDDDTIVFESNDVDCKYGLSNASTTPAEIRIDASYTGKIGLPQENANGYAEYRERYLTLGTDGDGSASSVTVHIGRGDGNGSRRIMLNTGDKQTNLTIHNTDRSEDGTTPAVVWKGTNASNAVQIVKGSLGIAYYAGESATVLTLKQGFVSSRNSDAEVHVGAGVTLGTIDKTGGEARVYCATTTAAYNRGGKLWLEGTGTHPLLHVTGGTCYANTTGTLGDYGSITGLTQADPGVVTSAAHGLSSGDKVVLSAVVGMTEVNHNEYTVGVTTTDTFQLLATDTSGYTAYSSGGYWAKKESVVIANDATLDFGGCLESRYVAAPIERYGEESSIKNWLNVTTLTSRSNELEVRNNYIEDENAIARQYTVVRKV